MRAKLDAASISERNRLAEENYRVVAWVARDVWSRHSLNRRFDFADLISVGHELLLLAAQTYEPGRGREFSSWACFTIRRGLGKWMKRNQGFYKLVPLSQIDDFPESRTSELFEQPDASPDYSEEVSWLLSQVSAEDARLVRLRYGIGCDAVPFTDLATMAGKSSSALHSHFQRVICPSLRRATQRTGYPGLPCKLGAA